MERRKPSPTNNAPEGVAAHVTQLQNEGRLPGAPGEGQPFQPIPAKLNKTGEQPVQHPLGASPEAYVVFPGELASPRSPPDGPVQSHGNDVLGLPNPEQGERAPNNQTVSESRVVWETIREQLGNSKRSLKDLYKVVPRETIYRWRYGKTHHVSYKVFNKVSQFLGYEPSELRSLIASDHPELHWDVLYDEVVNRELKDSESLSVSQRRRVITRVSNRRWRKSHPDLDRARQAEKRKRRREQEK